MLKKLKEIIFRIIYILLLIYLFLFIPKLWGYTPLVVVSGSMEPTLKVGGLLYYEKYNIEDFDRGDILVYETKENIISHRIIEQTEEGIITKGDSNNTPDGIIEKSQILGRGTNWCIPYIGYYADFIYGHKYILFILVGIVVLDLFNDGYSVHKKKVGEKLEE